MTNTIYTIDDITKVAAVEFADALKFCATINRQYDSSFGQSGAMKGDTIRIRLPNDFVVVQDNLDITSANKDYIERHTNLQLNYTSSIPLEFTSADLTLALDRLQEKVIRPAARRLAIDVETRAIKYAAQHTRNAKGTRGTAITDPKLFAQARAIAMLNRAPDEEVFALTEPMTEVEVVNSLKGLTESRAQVSSQYLTGRMKMALGLNWYGSTCYYTHTNGAYAGTPLTNGSNQGITTGWAAYTDLITDGWTSGQLSAKVGDIFTVDGVYATKPGSSVSLGYLRQFAVVADITDTTGDATIRISPAIISGGPYQNCTNRAADGKAITYLGASGVQSPECLVYHRDAFVMGMADLTLEGVATGNGSRVSDPDTGISIAIIKGMDTLTRKPIIRMDVLYGFSAVAPEWACRVVG